MAHNIIRKLIYHGSPDLSIFTLKIQLLEINIELFWLPMEQIPKFSRQILKCVNIVSDIDVAILGTNIDIVLFSNIVQPYVLCIVTHSCTVDLQIKNFVYTSGHKSKLS